MTTVAENFVKITPTSPAVFPCWMFDDVHFKWTFHKDDADGPFYHYSHFCQQKERPTTNPPEFSAMKEKLTPDQVEHWRDVLFNMVGSYALIASIEDIQRLKDEMQDRFSKLNDLSRTS